MVASGVNARVAYIMETTRGITPGTPQFTVQRALSRNINLKKDTIESGEVSGSRQRADLRHGFRRIEGQIQTELGLNTYNDWLQAATGTTGWFTNVIVQHGVSGVTSINVTGTNAFTRVGGNWIDDQYRPGDWIVSSGYTTPGNNGQHRVIDVSATVLTTASTLVNEASVGASTIQLVGQKTVVSGLFQQLRTFSLEREILDLDAAGLDLWQIFRGVGVNRLSVAARPDGLIGVNYDLIGMTGTVNGSATQDTNSVYTAAPTNSPMAAIDATVYNGTLQPSCTDFNFVMDNQRTVLPVIGRTTTDDLYEGVCKVTGSFSFLIQNALQMTAFQSETPRENGFQIRCNELGTSEFIVFNFYKAKYTTHEIDPPGGGPVLQVVNWEGLQKTWSGAGGVNVYQETMHIQRSS